MVDDNISEDANEKSLVVSDQEKGSTNKRKLVSELPLETPTDSPVVSVTEFPRYKLLEEALALKGGTLFEIEPLKGGCTQSDEEQEVEMPLDIDWEDALTSQLLELLTQNLSTIFQSAVKRIAKCGNSEEIAERVILRSGLYHGSKDAVSNVVDGALALLSNEKVFDNGRHLVFEDLPSLVDYTLLEMVCVLREVKPALPVAEAMWCLLILDLNLVHACTTEGDHLVELCSQEKLGDSSSCLKLSQSKTEASENTQSNLDKQQLSKPFSPIAQTLQSKVPVGSAASQEPESKNSHVHQAAKGKGSSTPLPKAEAKSKAAVLEDKSWAGQKALNSKKDVHRRKTYQFEKNCRSRMSKNIKANISAWDSLVLDKKLNSSDSSGATKKSSHSKKELQGWSDWANEKVMQATRRLSKDQPELKILRQVKEDAEKVRQEMQMLEENTMEKIVEMEQELVNSNSMIETTNSRLNTLERDNVELKKERHALMLSTGEYAMDVNNALAKEQEAVKKCQAADVEKRSFEEDLSTIKQEKAALHQQQEKANKVVNQFEVLSKQEARVKQRFLQQADSLKAEREQLRVQGQVQQDNFREKVERNMQKYKEEIQKYESEISQLRFQSERSKIEALKRGTPPMTKGLAAYAESSGSNVVKMERECVMCMNEQISVVFLPCAHQVLCEYCNVLHLKRGMDECPSCRTPIKERISVHFPDSE
ncbi:putative E3 ubiquitin-protein ligase RF4 isoform X2 [Solanum dulcamara]|uniref:putative E3 ubiquitin-protein ligase RF4 isoform X2 n=1 Tax=Solanum dulcamara TaxID=45834 RepID=UPI002485F1E6|nr:putative E3 ubiquitin-protein ligase RF4 isoform X2 [Solanum dulcamara]